MGEWADYWPGNDAPTLFGLDIIASTIGTTRPPTPGEEGRRIVRHGMADVLEWLGEPVGPAPSDPIPDRVIVLPGRVVMHPAHIAELRRNVSPTSDTTTPLTRHSPVTRTEQNVSPTDDTSTCG